jgi:hypothetical protein
MEQRGESVAGSPHSKEIVALHSDGEQLQHKNDRSRADKDIWENGGAELLEKARNSAQDWRAGRLGGL